MKDLKKNKKEDISKFKKDVDKEIAMQDKEIDNYRYPPLDLLNDNPDDMTDIKTVRNSALKLQKSLKRHCRVLGLRQSNQYKQGTGCNQI
jgi:hypothetical protein